VPCHALWLNSCVHGALQLCVCVWLTPFSRQPKSGLLGPAALLMLQQRAFSCISVGESKILYLPEKI
jgi:hypothetical protein